MRIVVARCSVEYSGRGETHLPPSVRAIIVKADGAVSIHADTNGNKPLNYMGAGNTMEETRRGRQRIWTFRKKNETIVVKLHSVLEDVTFDMSPEEPGLLRSGTEKDLHAYLQDHPQAIGLPAGTVLHHEFATGAGSVDLLAELSANHWIAVEVKRIATLPAVDQVQRYVHALQDSYPQITVSGLLVALDFKDTTIQQAESRGVTIAWIQLPPERL